MTNPENDFQQAMIAMVNSELQAHPELADPVLKLVQAMKRHDDPTAAGIRHAEGVAIDAAAVAELRAQLDAKDSAIEALKAQVAALTPAPDPGALIDDDLDD